MQKARLIFRYSTSKLASKRNDPAYSAAVKPSKWIKLAKGCSFTNKVAYFSVSLGLRLKTCSVGTQ